MSDFPKDGRYRIYIGSDTATVLDGKDVLTGQPIDGDTSLWDLYYVEGANDEKVCCLTRPNGSDYLGAPGVPLNRTVFLLSLQSGSSPSTWILRKANDGYTISIISQNKEYFWHLDYSGGQIEVASSDMSEIQSWKFDGPY